MCIELAITAVTHAVCKRDTGYLVVYNASHCQKSPVLIFIVVVFWSVSHFEMAEHSECGFDDS